MSAGLPVTEKPAIPTITGKEKAATVNKSSEDSRSNGYRELPVTEKFAVPTITDKRAASVNRFSEDSRVAGYREICCPHHYWQEDAFSQQVQG